MKTINGYGRFTINAADNTDYSLVFSEGIISCVDETGHIEAEFYVDDIPTIDAIPVVYCKDCKYANAERRNATEKKYADFILFCRNSHICNDKSLAMRPFDFCSYGWSRKVVDDEKS